MRITSAEERFERWFTARARTRSILRVVLLRPWARPKEGNSVIRDPGRCCDPSVIRDAEQSES